VVPAEVALRIRVELQHALEEERDESTVPLTAEQPLEVDLRRHDQEHAGDERQQQAHAALPDQSAGAAIAEGEPHAGAGDQEQQRHA
jgi:hypothetical protein